MRRMRQGQRLARPRSRRASSIWLWLCGGESATTGSGCGQAHGRAQDRRRETTLTDRSGARWRGRSPTCGLEGLTPRASISTSSRCLVSHRKKPQDSKTCDAVFEVGYGTTNPDMSERSFQTITSERRIAEVRAWPRLSGGRRGPGPAQGSLAWLEEFAVRRRLGQRWPEELGAREAEAFLILESEWEAEVQNG